ncbi:hypothetical protein IFM89_002016 [Coptis chinensis]|uniref:Uncharacterized protein n=1 Tax=Coptis chinensis TaxID=261450 RepID=A0A835LUH7_9MAGN|nr:hypothetical protein IFM89_002016 [Coptis chinensis]
MQFLAQKTVIYVTHQLEFLDASDLVLVIKDGSIVQSGIYEYLIADPYGELAPLWTGFGNLAEDKKELSRVVHQALHVLTNILSPKLENDYAHILEVFLENRGILVLFEILCFDFVGDLDVIDSCPTVVCRILIGLSDCGEAITAYYRLLWTHPGGGGGSTGLNLAQAADVLIATITTSGRANTSDTIDASG